SLRAGRRAAGRAESAWSGRLRMEASLTCAVCLSLFEEPVTLPLCSHNFCRDCVLECLASAELCPLPRGGAAALPVNTTLAELVRLYRSGTAGTAKAEETEQGPGSPLSLTGVCCQTSSTTYRGPGDFTVPTDLNAT
uniref:RING-type domain-containing protein n=1 Tax=Strigops habroptila TaxID=2489341 RepID=A0A672U625_STRHB